MPHAETVTPRLDVGRCRCHSLSGGSGEAGGQFVLLGEMLLALRGLRVIFAHTFGFHKTRNLPVPFDRILLSSFRALGDDDGQQAGGKR
jgi:hypothetical protein